MFKKTAFVVLAGALGLAGCQTHSNSSAATDANGNAVIGSQYQHNNEQALAPLTQAIADGMLGHDIASDLDEGDRTSLALRARNTLSSIDDGQPILWRSDHSDAHAVMTPISTSQEKIDVGLQHNAEVKVADNIKILNQPYKVRTGANLRKGPSTNNDRISSMSPGITFTALAETDSHWLLVGRQGVGIGYIYGTLAYPLKNLPETQIDSMEVTKGNALQDAFDLESMKIDTDTVSVNTECRELKIKLSKGKDADEDQVKACKNASGNWTIM